MAELPKSPEHPPTSPLSHPQGRCQGCMLLSNHPRGAASIATSAPGLETLTSSQGCCLNTTTFIGNHPISHLGLLPPQHHYIMLVLGKHHHAYAGWHHHAYAGYHAYYAGYWDFHWNHAYALLTASNEVGVWKGVLSLHESPGMSRVEHIKHSISIHPHRFCGAFLRFLICYGLSSLRWGW